MHRSIAGCFSIGLAAFCLSAVGAVAAPGGNPFALAPLHPGEQAAYDLAFVGKFGQPKDEIVDSRFSIALSKASDVTVSLHGPKPSSTQGTVAADGTIVVDKKAAVSDLVTDYNSVVMIVRGAAPEAAVASTWHSTIPVRTSPASWANVPVDVRVVSNDAKGVTIEAGGSKEDILYYNGFTMPVTVSAKLVAVFDANKRFRYADFSDSEVVQNLTVSYTWRLATERALTENLPARR